MRSVERQISQVSNCECCVLRYGWYPLSFLMKISGQCMVFSQQVRHCIQPKLSHVTFTVSSLIILTVNQHYDDKNSKRSNQQNVERVLKKPWRTREIWWICNLSFLLKNEDTSIPYWNNLCAKRPFNTKP